MVRTLLRRLAMAAVVGCAAAAPTDAATACDSLTSLTLGNGRVTSTQLVARAAFVPPAGPATGAVQVLYARLPEFCRTLLTLTPSSDSDIKVEIWLPASGWNGRFQAAGNGGYAGAIPYPGMARALVEGYATAGTDTGHVGDTAEFVPGHPEKLVDFAYRAVHEMAVAAKHVIDAHYGRAPQFSYFNGCSQGGRQAITSAQRYPADFDGIVAGAPAWDTMRGHAARLSLNFTVNRSPEAVIPPGKYAVVHDAVLKACDGLDGVTDGVIEDPTSCTVDFAALACTTGDGPACLTAPQVASARAITTPLTHPGTGEVIFPGYLMPGTELGWNVLAGPRPLTFALSGIANIVFGDKNWNDRSFTAAAHLDRIDASDRGLLKSNDPNLGPFFARGGKLLMYHGWADPQVPPPLSPLYYRNVLKSVGPSAEESMVLFMMPGVYHCGGGPGPDTFDRMGIIQAWVEHGQKPARIQAWHQTTGRTGRTRPLCPIGQVAAYQGVGSTDDAANFACVAAGAARTSTARR